MACGHYAVNRYLLTGMRHLFTGYSQAVPKAIVAVWCSQLLWETKNVPVSPRLFNEFRPALGLVLHLGVQEKLLQRVLDWRDASRWNRSS